MPYLITHLERKPGFVVRKVGEAYMVVPTGARMKEYKGVISINETGAFLFDRIKERTSHVELAKLLVEEYGITPPEAMQAVHMFVEQCSFAGLLVTEIVDRPDTTQTYIMDERTAEAIQKQLHEEAVIAQGQALLDGSEPLPEIQLVNVTKKMEEARKAAQEQEAEAAGAAQGEETTDKESEPKSEPEPDEKAQESV